MNPSIFYSKENRKTNGIFYTPSFVADYLAKKACYYFGDTSKLNSVLDPACGDSILLRSIASILLDKSPKISTKIIGIDQDINAIASSTARFAERSLKLLNSKFLQADALFPNNAKHSLDGWNELKKDLRHSKGFDMVLCNPPWGADLKKYTQSQLNSNFELAKGQFDIFNLFIEVILKNLKKGGVYGFILPDSIFGQDQYRLRQLLSHSTSINLVARLGEKIFPEINRSCVIIIGTKTPPPDNHYVDCFRLSTDYKKKVIGNELLLEQAETKLMHKIAQSRFYENENFVFDIDLKIDELSTFEKIQKNSISLKTLVDNTRGAEISKKGTVCQCPTCNNWMPLPKFNRPKCINCNTELLLESIVRERIILNHNGAGNFIFKAGEDLYRFTSKAKSWINIEKKGINYKDLKVYEGNKILVRKTGIGITASIDYENAFTTQVVYILKLKQNVHKHLSLEFVLAVLNSRALTYYLIKKFGENEWRSHPYLTQTTLINLPFPNINFYDKKSINLIEQVTHIIRDEVHLSKRKNISRNNDILIERIIAHFLKLDQTDYEIIFKTLESSEQLIPIKRLLNCTPKEIFKLNGI